MGSLKELLLSVAEDLDPDIAYEALQPLQNLRGFSI